METSVDSQVSYSRTKKQVDIRFQTNVSDVKSQRPRRQWCLNVIIVYHIFLTGVNAFLLYKVLTLRPSTSATSREKLTSSNHIPLGGEQDDVDLPMMIRNSSQETETLKGYLGALQSQVNSLCEEEGQLGRLRADLSLVNTSTYILEDKLAAISLRPGTPGPPGLKGDRGIPGHPGEAGMQGLAGTKGEKGQKGDNGVGSAGPPGPQGPKGETGPQGPPGSSGSHGSTGPMGPPGPSGPRGTVGPPGVPGSQGPGVKGDTGVPGVQGPPGRDGAKGAKGDTGMQGPQGTTGATGTKGQRGDTGLPGPAGPPGPRGPASSSSSTGPRGPPGPPGPKGDRGPLGRWDLQLSGFLATFRTRGRIELQYDGVWGTVCDDDFDILDATVICRMLGLSTATEVYTHGSGSGTIWLDNLQCTGSEWSIFECPHNGMGVNNCDHSEDVGVSCA